MNNNTNKCRACGGRLFDEPLFEFHNLPSSAQGMPSADELQDDHPIDLDLMQCSCCGLIQFTCEPVSYYKNVIRSTGFSSTMKAVRRREYAEFIKKYNLTGKRFIEIGCGRGEYLELLDEFEVKTYGLENDPSLCEDARAKSLTIYTGHMDYNNLILPTAPYDAFVCFNFLEHQPDPAAFLRGIYANLSENGVGLITVPDFDFILTGGGFYEFIRDHIVYYTKDTFRFVLEKNGFEVLYIGESNGDTLIAEVKKKSLCNITHIKETYNSMRKIADEFIHSVTTSDENHFDGKIAVWGASHQSFTILQMLGLDKNIEYIIDSAPFKQGRFSPASHILIVPPSHINDDPVDAIIIIAPTYSDEIAGIIKSNHPEVRTVASVVGNKIIRY